VTEISLDLTLLDPSERRDLANALLRAAWCAALVETRLVLLALSEEVDRLVHGESA
jgi:hypothetical protein